MPLNKETKTNQLLKISETQRALDAPENKEIQALKSSEITLVNIVS